ncbi:OpgC domain-containing protein [Bradyrhizobium sp.]|uniref:OpgC domain-containing protein n=1 Tax=Bradyrhizobium sp. TaxID=376 RepID=UPI003C7424E5
MDAKAVLARNARDTRLDLFLGLANWFIFLDHIPHNIVNWITVRNYGFSGAADAFVFISGYTAANVYAMIMLERGTVVGATRVLRRAWQLYAAFVVLFAIYIVAIGDVAARYAAPDIIYEFNIAGLVEEPVRTVAHGLLLQSRALNLDVLQLYVLLMACFPAVLWAMLRKPGLTMAASLVLYLAARQFEWNLSSFPDGSWNLNPFCWQLVFVLGAWCALGGTRDRQSIVKSPIPFYVGAAYLIFALAMTMAGRFPDFGHMFPSWLLDAFNPNDRTNLAPYRVLHFIVVALFVMRFMSKDWHGLKWPVFKPAILCGQQSLSVFCVGVFLSFTGHFVLMTGSGSLAEQLLVSVSGIMIMTLVAGYVSWSKRQDHPLPGRKPSLQAGEPTLSAGAPASGRIGRYPLMRSSR